MARKFKEYLIKITNIDGSEEIVNTVDKTSYKQTMEDYIAIREEANESEDICTIEFIGITQSDEEQIQFTKEYNRKKKYSVSDNIDDLISDAKEIFEIIEKKYEHNHEAMGVVAKKTDVEMHKIESIDLFQGDPTQEKINIIDTLNLLRKQRRYIKEEQGKLARIKPKVEIIKKTLDSISIPIKELNLEYLSEEVLTQKDIFKEVKYANEKDRITKRKQLEPKYSKIVTDEARKILVCYNLANGKKVK